MLDPADDEVSYQHRIRLKMACVRHVLPVWYRGFPGDQRVEEAIVFTQDLMGRRVTDIRQARRFAENLLDSVMNDLSSSVTEVEPGLLKPDATKEASSFVADAASMMTISACHRDPDMDLWEEFDEMVDDDELLSSPATAAPAPLPVP